MKQKIELFLLELLKQDYNIRWIQGLERVEKDNRGVNREVIKMYDTQTDQILGTIEVGKPYYTGEIGDLIREVKYPLLDPETLDNHIRGMVKVDPTYNKYKHLITSKEKTREELVEEVKESRDNLLNHLTRSIEIDYTEGKDKEIKLRQGESGRLGKEFNYNPVHVGLVVSEDLWQHDLWTIIVEGQVFDYKTGIGHRKCREPKRLYKDKFNKLMNGNFKKDRESLTLVNTALLEVSKPVAPTVDDVLHSLLMDAMVVQESFEDFCDNLGYDSDSRKALSIYEACQENSKKLKTFIKDVEEAQEAFEDY